MKKIFDCADLVIWSKKDKPEGILYSTDLKVEQKGKDITKNILRLDIIISAGQPVIYKLEMLPLFERIKRYIWTSESNC